MVKNDTDLLMELELFRVKNGLQKKDIAKLLGANSQILTNWYARNSLPKNYVLKVVELLRQETPPIPIKELVLRKFEQLDPENQKLMLNLLDRLADQSSD